MGIRLRHAKVVAAPDSNDGKVSTNAWNDQHVLTGTANMLLGFDPSGNVAEIDPSTISGGGLTSAVVPVANRTALAALSTLTPAYLKESGREGIFVWSSSSLSSQVTSDPRQAVYVAPATDTSGASGAWVRKYSGDLNIRWFGTVGDGTTDDYAAFAAAVTFLGNPGGAIFVPPARYRMSATLVIPAGIRLYGAHTARNPGQIGATSYPYPTFYTMGVLYYDAGIPGIELQPNTAATATSTGATTYDQAGATWVQIENLAILSAGGGTADTYGIKNRVVAYLTNVYVRGFLGHGVFTTALGGGSPYDDEIYGNADQSIYTNVHATSCGQHGFYTTGGDSNVILFNSCNASANGGWGFYDHSLLGNMYLNCHTTSNTLGSYKNTSAVGSSTYIGCYIEGSSLTDLSAACAWYNGQGGSVSLHPAGSPAYIQGGGANSFGAPLIHYNNQGATQVSFQMGVRGSGLAAWAWGDNSDTPTAASFQMVLGKAGSNAWSVDWWNLIRGGSARLVQYPKASVGARADAPSFPNGLFLGVAATGPRIFYGTAAPGSGTWALGDIVWNSTPSVGATMYWRCTVAGSPGTWEAVSLLSASPTVGVGYTTGAGGTVTQSTSKSTGVTLNKVCGSITMNGAALAATTAVSFTLTNSTIAADDNVIVRVKSGYATAATYRAWAEGNASGSRTIILENISAGSLSEAVVLGFTVVKSASS